MAPKKLIVIVIVAICLASPGCVNRTPENQEPEIPEILSSEDSPLFSDCNSWTATQVGIPSSIIRNPSPPEWQAENHVTSAIIFMIMECQRVTWGPFSRGPIQMGFLAHTKIDPPAQCRGEHIDSPFFMENAWISDEEMATWLAEEVGIPIVHATMSSTTEQNPGLHFQRWSIIAKSGPENWFEFEWQVLNEQSGADNISLLWHTGDATGRLDLPEQYIAPAPQLSGSRGWLELPFVYPFPEGSTWIAQSVVHWNVQSDATIELFGGPECESE